MAEMEVEFHIKNLAKHGIAPFEAEEAFYDGWGRRRKNGENYEVLGQTEEGRYLQLVVELQSGVIRVVDGKEEKGKKARVFHGRDMNDAERKRYTRK